MNYLKKNCFLNRIVILFFLVICSIWLQGCKNKYINFVTFPKDYTVIVESGEPAFNFNIYVSNKHLIYFNLNSISRAEITSKDNGDNYLVEIKNIVHQNDRIEYQNEVLYNSILDIVIPMVDKILKIPNAYLNLYYLNGETVQLKVGNITFGNYENNKTLNISYLKGIINNINQTDTLVGIILRIYNTNYNPITIRNFMLLNCWVYPDNENIKLIEQIPENNTIPIKDILQKEYIYNKTNKQPSIEFVIPPNTELTIIIPILYLKFFQTNELAIVIDYLCLNKSYYQIINTFRFFSTTASYDTLWVNKYYGFKNL